MLRDKALRMTILSYLVAIVLLAAAEALTGCSAASGYEPDETPINAFVSDQIAYHEPQPAKAKPEPKRTCDECKGTGEVWTGDRLAKVPCPCGKGCQCTRDSGSKPQAVQDSRPIVTVYYAKDFYCPPCETLKQSLGQVPYVRFVESTGPDPWWIEAYPTLHWTGDDGQEYQLASGDINDFIAKLRVRNPSLFVDEAVRQQDASGTAFSAPPQQPAMVTRRGRIISRGCRGGRCR